MRVGIDGYPLSQPRTGVGHYTFELARALAALSPADQFELVSPAPFDEASRVDIERSNLPNLLATHVKTSRIRGHWWGVGLPLYARQARFDIFHGTNFEAPAWSRRSVVTIHDLSTMLHRDKHRAALSRRARIRLPIVVKLAKKIITPTEAIKDEVCKHLRVPTQKVIAIHSATRENFHPASLEETIAMRRRLGIDGHFLLFVGTLEPRKNLLALLRAFEKVIQKTSLRPLLVITGGEGWLMDETFSFIGNSAIQDRIRLTGYLDDQDLRALYSSCRIFIYPSLYEGFGFPPLEAMACGAPVIAGRVPALCEVLGDAAEFIDPLDAEALGTRMIELLLDDEELRRLSANGLVHASEFSWRETAQRTLDVYREVAET